MARFKSLIFLSSCLALAACGGDATTNSAVGVADNGAEQLASVNLAEANTAAGGVVSAGEGDTEFRVSWPAAAASIAPLNAILRAKAEELRKETEAGLIAEQAASKEGGYPFRGYSYTEDWGVAADSATLLVLRSEGYTYTGGAHGMPLVDVLYWDKAGAKALTSGDVFNEAALGAAVKDRFCAALDAQRAEKRGGSLEAREPSPITDFDACVDPIGQKIVPISATGGGLDRILFVIMPYEAGPYAEGIYEVEVPVDAAVLNAVKPAWKSAFTAN